METLLANLNGTIRREMLGGREYLVAPVNLIVCGVLNGSQGPLYYPPEEVGKDPMAWNGMPLVVYHPTVEDVPVSARSPVVLEDCGVGFLFNTVFTEDVLAGEAWFDAERTKRYDERLEDKFKLYPRLVRGDHIETSTGLFTRNDPPILAEGQTRAADPKGTPYDYVARDHKPDHLAVLPDILGACNRNHGCGINPTPINNEGNEAVDKKNLIKWLTTNCKCWKDKDDAKTLEGYTVEKLTALKDAAVAAAVANAAKAGAGGKLSITQLTYNAEGDGEVAGVDIASLADFLGVTIDASKDPVGFVKELNAKLTEISKRLNPDAPSDEPDTDDAPAPDDAPATPAPTGNRNGTVKNKKPQSLKEWEANLHPDAAAIWGDVKQQHVAQKAQLVETVVNAQAKSDDAKPALRAVYNAMDKKQLEVIVVALPTPAPATNAGEWVPSFVGAGQPVPNINRGNGLDYDPDDVLPMTTLADFQ